MTSRIAYRALTCAFAAAMAAYLFLNRHTGLAFFDGTEYSIHIRSGGIAHAPGYPLYVMLGQLLYPLTGDPFLAQSLISLASLLFSAFAFYRSLAPAAAADDAEPALLLTVVLLLSSYYLKKYTVLPEVFLLNVALFAGLAWSLRAWYDAPRPLRMGAVFMVYGLGLAHHHTLALTLPGTLLLVAWRWRKFALLPTLGCAALGAVLGALPLLQLFYAVRPGETFTTYFLIGSFSDFLFVLLRRGYGTLSLSAARPAGGPGANFALAAAGLLRNFNFVGALLLVPLGAWLWRARPWGARLRDAPLLAWSGVTLLVFLVFFLPLANLPAGTETYKNAFLRFLTVPGFLLLYPAYYALRFLWLRWPEPRGRRALFAAAFALVTLSNLWGWRELRFRHFDMLDEHLRSAYAAVFRETAPALDLPEVGFHQCAIFAKADSLVYGLRYYNMFGTAARCYVFSPASFSGQFRAIFEEQLQARAFGAAYPGLLARYQDSHPELVKLLFMRLKAKGFRLFVVYRPDAGFFAGTPLRARPLGSIVELYLDSDPAPPPGALLDAHGRYLDGLQAYLARRGPADIPSNVIDDVAWSSLTQNLLEAGAEWAAVFDADPGLRDRRERLAGQARALMRDQVPPFP